MDDVVGTINIDTSFLLAKDPVAARSIQAGIELFLQNRFAQAIPLFEEALKIDPDNRFARWNRTTAILSTGDYARGFPEYDCCWRLFDYRGFGPVKADIDRLEVLPMWRGECGVRVLVYHELGFGDAIMAMRYLPELKRRTAMTLVLDPCLVRLAQQFGVDVVTKVPDDLTGYEYRLPFFGVMSALGETVETIPRAPYIAANWQRTGGKVGVNWSGRTQTMFAAMDFIAWLRLDGYRFYSLKPDPAPPPHVQPLQADDFADTATVIEQMDHIVTIDSAVAHLAGAMGHPSIHLLLPFVSDWRWWNASAWYPTIKTYRQSHYGSDWTLPFAQVNDVLTAKE